MRTIKSVTDLVRFASATTPGRRTFFRGASSTQYDPIPTAFRSGNKDEKEYYDEILRAFPLEFRGLTHFEILEKMRHCQVPNRLLDITSNPLVALYFACESGDSTDGAIYVYEADERNICGIQSDRVLMLSCLPCLRKETRDELFLLASTRKTQGQFKKSDYAAKRGCLALFMHEIRREFPAFEDEIVPLDLLEPLFVMGSAVDARIAAQKGSFILSPLGDDATRKTQAKHLYANKWIIQKEKKKEIRRVLEILGIDASTVYPDIERRAVVTMGSYFAIKKLGD